MSSTTDPGDRSPREIERELEEERRRLRETGRALQNRLSVGTLVDEVLARTRDRGPDYALGFGRTLRDNPIPVALIGISLAWLMAGGQRASEERFRHDRTSGLDDDELYPRPTPFGAAPVPDGPVAPAADEPLRKPPPAAGPAEPFRPTPRPAGDIGAAPPPASPRPSPLAGDTGPAKSDPLGGGTGPAKTGPSAGGTGPAKNDPLATDRADKDPVGLRGGTPREERDNDDPLAPGKDTQSGGSPSTTPPPAARPAGTDEPKRPWQTDDKDKS